MMHRKVVFLDRDGTINVDYGYVSRIEHWQFLDGALDALKSLSTAGYALAIVTNQSGIARGYYSEADLQSLHQHMKQLAAQQDVTFDAIVHCPHGPDDDCTCRKPATHMSQQVQQQLDCKIDYPNSWTIGDKPSDIAFGNALGTHTALLTSPNWTTNDLVQHPDLIADSLQQITTQILNKNHYALSQGNAGP